MNTQKSSSLYGAAAGYNMDDYGGDGVGSMMALTTQHEADPEMTRVVPISCYNHAPAQSNQCLVCAAAMLQNSRGNNLNEPADEGGSLLVMEQFIPEQKGVMSADSPMASVKTEEERGVYAHPPFLGHAEEQSPGKPNSYEHETDEFKANIIGHVYYPRLLAAYADCQKVGAPPELVSELNELSEKCQGRNSVASVSIGADSELDQFMEAYCDLFIKFREELTKPFQEAMIFFKKIESQLGVGLGSPSKGPVRSPPLGEDVKIGKRVGISSIEDEIKSKDDKSEDVNEMEGAMKLELEVDPHVADRELKGQLLRKYSGYLSSLKQEFLKKRKKGKIPQAARKMLLDWWNTHYKWPYPSESQKLALAKSSGLDQKQINNWFINQRKRHWKPSEEVQFVVMDGPYNYPHSHPHNITNPMTKTLYVDTMHLRGDETTFYMDY